MNGGGSCRWHRSFSVWWLGARHFLFCMSNSMITWEKEVEDKMCWKVDFFLVGTLKSKHKQTWMWRERRLGADWRQQVSRNRLALSTRWCLRLPFFFLGCFVPPPLRAYTIYPAIVFLTWTLLCFMAFSFSSYPHQQQHEPFIFLLDSRHYKRI